MRLQEYREVLKQYDDRVKNSYAQLLIDFDWQVFFTQTFRTHRHDAHNCVMATWAKLENKLGWTRGFCAAESHKLGGIHVHYVLSNDLDLRPDDMIKTCKYMHKAFGFCHMYEVSQQASVSHYVAKYVTKDNGDYYFLGTTWT